MNKSKDVATNQPHELSTQVNHYEQEILNTDIIIPRLLLMQNMSDLVVERKAQGGDFVKTSTGEKLGDPEVPVDVIPLKMSMSWAIMELVNTKYEFRRTEPRTPLNENLPWEYTEKDKSFRRVKTIDLLCLLPKDIEAYHKEIEQVKKTGEMPDLNKTLLPLAFSFRSTGFSAGKTVATFFAQLRDLQRYNEKVRPYHYVLPLSCTLEKNDKGQFYVPSVGKSKKLEEKYVGEAERWYSTLQSKANIVVEAEESPVEESAPQQARAQSAPPRSTSRF